MDSLFKTGLDWYERACIALERELADELITHKEFAQGMRDLNKEWDEERRNGEHYYE